MEANYLNRFGAVCGAGTDHRTLPEAELWTQVILRAIEDLEKRTSLTSTSAQDSAREWFASDSDALGSFIWICHAINVDPNLIRSGLAKKYRMNPDDVVMTSGSQRLKRSRVKVIQTFVGQSRSHPSRRQDFKRALG